MLLLPLVALATSWYVPFPTLHFSRRVAHPKTLSLFSLEASSSVLPSPVPTETAATELPLASTGSDLFSAAPTTSDAVDSSTLLESYSVFSSSSSSSSSDLTPPTTIIEASATTSHSPTATSSLVIVTVVATTPLSSSRFVTSPVLPLTLSQTRTSSSTTKSTLAAASGTGGVGMEVIPGPVRSSTSGAGGRMKGERWVWVGLFVASSTFLLG